MLSVSGERSNLSTGISSVWPRNEKEISIELAAGIALEIPKCGGGEGHRRKVNAGMGKDGEVVFPTTR
jgi:hypothetical protein